MLVNQDCQHPDSILIRHSANFSRTGQSPSAGKSNRSSFHSFSSALMDFLAASAMGFVHSWWIRERPPANQIALLTFAL
jgi:hypothetical protein